MRNATVAFKPRRVAFGFTDGLPVDVAVLDRGQETWVVLRESALRAGQTALLATYFECIAASLRMELTYLKGLPGPLRFFYCTYEAGNRGAVVRWVFKEVRSPAGGSSNTPARWDRAKEATQVELSAALSLSEPPKRTCL
jgi:hypothetical protein